MSAPTRILIIRFSSIGDIVLTSPIIRALKTQMEGNIEIHFITKTKFASIVESNPHISSVLSIDKHVSEVKHILEDTHFHYVVDLHNNLRSRQVKRCVKALSFTVDKRNLAKWIYVQTKKVSLPIGHYTQRCFEAVKALGVTDDGKGLDFYIPESQAVSLNILPSHFQSGYIAYAIGGLEHGKVLPAHQVVNLCKQINRPVVLVGGPEDRNRGHEIATAAGGNVHSLCGDLSLAKSSSILNQADCVISHDTGLMHIAAALKKKVISLWFATTPELGFAPWQPGEGSTMIEADCKKRPTSKLGNRGYQDGCVYNIDLKRIVELVKT